MLGSLETGARARGCYVFPYWVEKDLVYGFVFECVNGPTSRLGHFPCTFCTTILL